MSDEKRIYHHQVYKMKYHIDSRQLWLVIRYYYTQRAADQIIKTLTQRYPISNAVRVIYIRDLLTFIQNLMIDKL